MFRKKWAIVLLAFFVLMVDSSYAKSEIKNNSVSDVRQSKNAASIWEDLWKWKFSSKYFTKQLINFLIKHNFAKK